MVLIKPFESPNVCHIKYFLCLKTLMKRITQNLVITVCRIDRIGISIHITRFKNGRIDCMNIKNSKSSIASNFKQPPGVPEPPICNLRVIIMDNH